MLNILFLILGLSLASAFWFSVGLLQSRPIRIARKRTHKPKPVPAPAPIPTPAPVQEAAQPTPPPAEESDYIKRIEEQYETTEKDIRDISMFISGGITREREKIEMDRLRKHYAKLNSLSIILIQNKMLKP